MFGSCYYLHSDRGDLLRAYRSLRESDRPHIRIHGGDQLYLDAGALDDDLGYLETNDKQV